MLGRLLAFDQTIWIVAAALYLLDVARRIEPDQILLEERSGLGLRAVLARRPFEWGRRHLYLVGPFAPQRAVLVASQDGPSSGPEVQAELQRLDQVRRAMRPLRALAVAMFALLFVAGPIGTAWVGATSSILWLAAPVYGLALVSALVVALRRGLLALSAGQAATLALECVLCPPYVANLPKKIGALQQLHCSGIAAAKLRMDAQGSALLDETLRLRAQEESG